MSSGWILSSHLASLQHLQHTLLLRQYSESLLQTRFIVSSIVYSLRSGFPLASLVLIWPPFFTLHFQIEKMRVTDQR